MNRVVVAMHGGDHELYPDCRPQFYDVFMKSVILGTDNGISIDAPFLNFTKNEIVKTGFKVGAPMHLTYSCYKGGLIHCGKCGTCIERKMAFARAAVADETKYEDNSL